MSYTPVELRHVRVPRSFLGYKRTAVRDLLTDLADSFETVWRERHELADRCEEMGRELASFRERERALTQTLIASEQTAAQVKDQARIEADRIIAEAHTQARSIGGEHLRVEALLRMALTMIEESEAVAEPPPESASAWPDREDMRDFPKPVEVEPLEPLDPAEPQQPELRRVSGGFDWLE